MDLELNPALSTNLMRVPVFLNEISSEFPEAISFAAGRPAAGFFEVEEVHSQLERYITHRATQSGADRADVLSGLEQYGRTNGIICDLIAQHLRRDENIDADPEAIVVTAGSQEGMSILLQGIFRRDADVLLATDPNYVGMTGAAHLLGIRSQPVPKNDNGIDLGRLRLLLKSLRAEGLRPKALYDIPDFHNPLGTAMSLAERGQLLEIASDERLLIIEDNPYGFFAYDDERLPTLKALDKGRTVFYLGTFSKTLFPSLRIGYVVTTEAEVARELAKVKGLTTLNTSALLQAVVGGFLLESDYSLREHVAPKVRRYRLNRDLMVEALERHLGKGAPLAGKVQWNRPRGGFFITVETPFVWLEEHVRRCAAEQGLIVCPMSFFSLAKGRETQIRISFSAVEPEQIDEGVRRLTRFLVTEIE